MSRRRTDDAAIERRAFAVRTSLFFAALFLVFGLQLPYFPVWLDWRGLTVGEIAIVIAVPSVVRLLTTPLIAFLADRTGRHGLVLTVAGVTALLAAVALIAAPSFAAILIASTVLGVALAVALPIADSVAMTGVRTAGLDYGRMRLWGSITFVLAGVIGGQAIAVYGAGSIQVLVVATVAMTLLAGLLLPAPRGGGELRAARPLAPHDVVRLLRSAPIVLLLLASTAVQASHAVIYAFGSLHWRALGFDPTTIGVLWAIGVCVEIALFAVSGAAVQRFGPVGLIALGAGAAVVRWSAMAGDPGLAATILLQAFHGLTFGASHLGAMHMLARAVPERQAGTAQALLATLTGGVMALATLAAGWLYARYAGLAYLGAALLGLIGLVATAALWRSSNGERVVCDR